MRCEYCGRFMKEGTHYWGNYCDTRGCFNSETERTLKGERFRRVRPNKANR